MTASPCAGLGMTAADLEGMRGTGEPSGILLEPWFLRNAAAKVRGEGADETADETADDYR